MGSRSSALRVQEKSENPEDKPKSPTKELKNRTFENILEYLKQYDCREELIEIMNDDKDRNNFTANIWLKASETGNIDITNLLINNGMNVDEMNKIFGWSALMWASQSGHLDVVKLLLEKGANVNKEDGEGDTALMFASKKGHLKVVKYLLEKGADKNIQNEEDETAFDLAKNSEIKNLLR